LCWESAAELSIDATVMCKKAVGFCRELGTDPVRWSRRSPLPPPAWFDQELATFAHATTAASAGAADKAVALLATIRSDDMREWFDVHGQNTGWHRANAFRIPVAKLPVGQLDPRRRPAIFEQAVFQRDGYRCRYCGLRVIAKRVLVAVDKAVGVTQFCATASTNAALHGVVHAFKAVADHVVPHALGGRTDLDNLVTACGGCNYGKFHYTVEQLGMDDPRAREPAITGWDGLLAFLPGLQQHMLPVHPGVGTTPAR
jgi:hypothetical protein